uniref:Uncharacterized protein n=1 Tax=Cacopsylla melanoneura TaxID=428564 RepID=A0A8D9E4V5_9HEMI
MFYYYYLFIFVKGASNQRYVKVRNQISTIILGETKLRSLSNSYRVKRPSSCSNNAHMKTILNRCRSGLEILCIVVNMWIVGTINIKIMYFMGMGILVRLYRYTYILIFLRINHLNDNKNLWPICFQHNFDKIMGKTWSNKKRQAKYLRVQSQHF